MNAVYMKKMHEYGVSLYAIRAVIAGKWVNNIQQEKVTHFKRNLWLRMYNYEFSNGQKYDPKFKGHIIYGEYVFIDIHSNKKINDNYYRWIFWRYSNQNFKRN